MRFGVGGQGMIVRFRSDKEHTLVGMDCAGQTL